MRCRPASLALLAWSLAGSTALAAGPPARPDPKAAARALAEQGHTLHEAGKYAEAIDVLQRAEKLFHAPTLILALARAHVGAGQLLEARALLQTLVAEKLAINAPRAFTEAQRSGKDELAVLDARIPTVRVRVSGAGPGLRVSLDDREIADHRPDRPLPANPGAHRVTVTPAVGAPVIHAFELSEGARLVVDIDLLAAARARDAAPAAAPRPWLAPAIASFGLGAVGLGVGLGAGFATLSAASDLKARCGAVCPPTDANKSDVAAANGLGIASTVGFALAGAGVVTGVVLLVVKPGARADARTATSVDVGPGSIRISGVF